MKSSWGRSSFVDDLPTNHDPCLALRVVAGMALLVLRVPGP